MQIKVLWIGKESRSFFSDAENELLKRLRQWCKIELIQLNSGNKEYPNESALIEAERILIEEKLETFKGGTIVLLHEDAKPTTSKDFSSFISKAQDSGESLCFIIGGAYGLSRQLLTQPRLRKLSLSPMTFPHHVARYLLIEQLYRAFTIIAGHPYHK